MPTSPATRSSTPTREPVVRIAVIGAGTTGIASATHLAALGYDPVVFEGSDRVGGQVKSIDVEPGTTVELGAEALYTTGGMPQPFNPPADGVAQARPCRAWIGIPGRSRDRHATPYSNRADSKPIPPVVLRKLPDGVGPTGPTKLRPVATSRILSPLGLLRAALEAARPRSDVNDETSVGHLVTERFGIQVARRIVDPLLGNLHSADIFCLDAHSCAPQLVEHLTSNRSVLVAAMQQTTGRNADQGGQTPRFYAAVSGLQREIEQLAAELDVRLGQPVGTVLPTDNGTYRIAIRTRRRTTQETFDAVVVATEAAAASRMLADAGGITGTLGRCRTASVTCVVVAYPRAAISSLAAFAGSGIMLPSHYPGLLKSATFLSSKWTHLDGGSTFLVRMSTGRLGDTRAEGLGDSHLVAQLHRELCSITGLRAAPEPIAIQRWSDVLPVNELGHRQRILAARSHLAMHRPGVFLAGAAFDGPGITNCLRSAERVTHAVAHYIEGRPPHA